MTDRRPLRDVLLRWSLAKQRRGNRQDCCKHHESSWRESPLGIFPHGSQSDNFATEPPLAWYAWWLRRQFGSLPHELLEFVKAQQEGQDVGTLLSSLFVATARSARMRPDTGIDNIITYLAEDALLRFPNGGSPKETEQARALIFAFLGWQTMLYIPAFGEAPPDQFAIADVLDGYQGQAFMTLKQGHSATQENLQLLLLGFGLMLPSQNLCLSDDIQDKAVFGDTSTIQSGELNTSLLQTFAKIKIKWIDVLAPHMELDVATNTLFLFRYPSFLLANLSTTNEEGRVGSILECCADTTGLLDQWMFQEDVDAFLLELLRSYRLLFGQDKASRKLFKSTNPFSGIPLEGEDPVLGRLCGRKMLELPEHPFANLTDRDYYRLHRDFPFLRSRIITLKRLLDAGKPRGWKELWWDRRNAGQWYTFWAVIIIGGAGIVLAALQVALSAAQLAVSFKTPG